MDYPYYIAQYKEERFPSPPGMKHVYRYFNQRMREISDSDINILLRQLQAKGINPQFDVDFYVVERNRPRQRLRYDKILGLSRS